MIGRVNLFEAIMIILSGIPCFGERLDKTREIVFPRLLESRSTSDPLVLVINKEHTLNLRRSTVFSDSVMIKTHEGKTPIRNFISGADLNKQLFHDSDKMASVFLSQSKNLQVEGVLSATRGIKPLSAHEYPSESSETPHVIYDIHESMLAEHGDRRKRASYANLQSESGMVFNIEERAAKPSKAKKPKASSKDTIYPELFVVFDPNLQPVLQSLEKAVKYMGATLNSVNLMMRSITKPKVQMRLCGAEFASAEIEDVFIKVEGSSYLIDDNATLYKFASYVDNEPDYANYSYVYLATGKDLAYENSTQGQLVSGMAFLGTPCGKYRVGLYEDDGHFSGIIVMAHELGHSLGCPHDGEASSIPGAPGSTNCGWNEGYIMGSGRHPWKKYSYSRCCVDNMRYVINLDRSKCLKEKRCTYHRETALPGDLTDVTTFCSQKTHNGETLFYEDIFKAISKCLVTCRTQADQTGTYTYLNYTALDGTKCENSGTTQKVCVKGNCTLPPKLLTGSTTSAYV